MPIEIEVTPTRELWPGRLVVVECPQDWTVFLAMDVWLLEGEELQWSDGHGLHGFGLERIIKQTEQELILQREAGPHGEFFGWQYTFRPLTETIYHTLVKPRLAIEQEFSNLAEAEAFLLESL